MLHIIIHRCFLLFSLMYGTHACLLLWQNIYQRYKEMDMIKPELHVVQQIRRDKCRVEEMNDFQNTWDHHHHQHQHQNIRIPNNLDLIGILQNQISLPVQTDAYQDCTTTFMNNPQGSSTWRSTDLSQPGYGYDQASIRPSNVGDLFSNHFSSRNQVLDPPLYVGRDTRSEISCLDDNQKGCVTVACSGTGNEILKRSYDQGSSSGSYRGELVFLPSQWNDRSSCKEPLNYTATSHTNKKDFSLSLSSEVTPLRDGGNAGVSSTMNIHGHLGPLGPFTGYASILKSSRFLEPAENMLEEFCISYALKNVSVSESTSMDNDDSSEMLSSTNHAVDRLSSSSEALEPKNRLKRAKLLFLQEEVCETTFLFSCAYNKNIFCEYNQLDI